MKQGLLTASSVFALILPSATLLAQEEGERSVRQIEEVTVTAERRESTVQDTAISITAFTDEFLEDFGIRNQEDLQNYIPATTIQPYDLSIRGIGRLFRALGGDPGVATYINGTYSEDFGIVSTEGGLYDIERIEVLRGPQGTLYGRNGIGGAVNFHSRKPHEEIEGHARTVLGSHQTQDIYGTLNFPIIKDTLLARVNATRRDRGGVMNDLTPGNPHINDWGDTNYALSLRWLPSDTITMDLRVNDRDYDRRMSGAQGAGAVLISENGGMGDEITGGQRNTSAMVHGYRPVDPRAGMCDSQVAAPVRTVGGMPSPNCVIPGRQVFDFTWDGITRYGQRLVPGIDPAGLQYDPATGGPDYSELQTAFGRPNYAYNWRNPLADAEINDELEAGLLGNGATVPSLTGSEIVTNTNGHNNEFFDHNAAYFNAEWVATEWLTVKYIGQYTDYFYSRVTDDDRTGNYYDQQFYAGQQNENYQHEVQFFIDIGEDIQITSGLFWFGNDIEQQLDFYSPEGWSRYAAPAAYGDSHVALAAGALATGTSTYAAFTDLTGALGQLNALSARDYLRSGGGPVGIGNLVPAIGAAGTLGGINLKNVIQAPQFSDPSIIESSLLYSLWLGDPGDAVTQGDSTPGTTFVWDTTNETDAFAIYAQGEWQVTPRWAITAGVRLAQDDKKATEAILLYNEIPLSPGALYAFNRSTGAIRPDGDPTGRQHIRFTGIPIGRSAWRSMENDFEDTTWRVNIDFTPTDDVLTYFSVTTGYRAGGFNLGYYSAVPTYEPETLIAYELGYKGRMLDNTMQINASVYYYAYEDIHLQSVGRSILGGFNTSVVNGPEAETRGFEFEGLWLATDDLTLGLTYSYTDSEYVEEYVLQGAEGVVASTNPYAPSSLYTPQELLYSIKGKQLPRVPKHKVNAWAEYGWSLGGLGNMVLASTFSWTDEFPAAGRPVGDLAIDIAPAFMRWDARLGWSSADEVWEIIGFVNNITDEIGIRNVFTYDEQQGYRRVIEPTLPRMMGVEVQYRFGAFK
ncbi:MAG: TonB-dependent receptor [Gammaproteobacteria bacterium]|nr:TonB-dependent receptor [Gammaproteobacteria bacterium]